MNYIRQKYSSLSNNERTAFWLIMVVALAMVTFSFITFPKFIRFPDLIRKITNGLPVVMALVSIASAVLILYRRTIVGGALFAAGFTLGMTLMPVVLSDMAFLAAILVFVVGSLFSTLVFPARIRRWLGFIFGAAAIVILLIDSLSDFLVQYTGQRDFIVASDLRLAWFFASLIILVYGFFLAKQFLSFPLRDKLIVVSLILTIIPTSAVGIISNQTSTEALTKNANDSLSSAAAQVAGNLDYFVLTNLDAVRAEAMYPDFIAILRLSPEERASNPETEETITTLKALSQKSPYITSYGLIDRSGIDIADSDEREIGQDKSDRAYFQTVLQTGKPYVSPFGYSALANNPSIFFSAPVRNNLNETIGVLRVRYRASIVQALMTRQGNFDAGQSFAMVVTENDILLADSSDPDHMYKSIVPLDDARLKALQQARLFPETTTLEESSVDFPDLAAGIRNYQNSPNFSGEFHAVSEGSLHSVERVGVSRLENVPWYVVVGQSESGLLAPVREQTRAALLVALIASLLAIAFGFLVAWFLASPLTRLAEAAGQLATGNLAARATVKTEDEFRTLANAFNSMAEQLAGLVGALEQRVADRTRALATSAEVSRRLSTIIKTDELVKEVVEELQHSFNYYHVHIYLFDEQSQNLVMAAGSGEAGLLMLARSHSLPRGRGLVGRAAETNTPVLVEDVRESSGWLANPLLPNTQSEVAVPIAVGRQVLGVLDVQQDRVNGLQQEDVELLQSIANQVAVALQNARRYQEAEREASREAQISAIVQRIQVTGSVEEALQVAVREVGRALGAEGVYVELDARKNGQK